jgi:hypothetical protein
MGGWRQIDQVLTARVDYVFLSFTNFALADGA